MTHIPPIDTEQTATKNDLKQLETRLSAKIERLDIKFDAAFKDVDSRFKDVDSRFKDVQSEFKDVRSEMAFGFSQLPKQFVILGLTLALPTWLGLIGLIVTVILTAI